MTLTLIRCTAEIRISARSKRVARSICNALSPDLFAFSEVGEKASISSEGANITMNFESNNVPSLRANLNSALLLWDALSRCLTV